MKIFIKAKKWNLAEPAFKGGLSLKEIPREYTGLKNDGTRDMRFKRGETYAELGEYLHNALGDSLDNLPKIGVSTSDNGLNIKNHNYKLRHSIQCKNKKCL